MLDSKATIQYDQPYKYPEWSIEGLRERHGAEQADVIFQSYLDKLLSGSSSLSINYYEYIQSPEWKTKAEAAKKRAGYRCVVCNGTDRLEAHHRTYERLGNELPEDITALDHDCHELFSKYGRLKR